MMARLPRSDEWLGLLKGANKRPRVSPPCTLAQMAEYFF